MKKGEYDPVVHDGLIWAGKTIIVADAKQAQLNKVPDNVRFEIARLTLSRFRLVTGLAGFSRGIGGMFFQMDDEQAVGNEISGLVRGVALLGLTPAQLVEAGLLLNEQSDFFEIAENKTSGIE